MYQLPQEIWNQIAKETTLETQAAKVAFSLNELQAEKMQILWRKLEEQAGTPSWAISSIKTALPLLVEKDAIAQWFQEHPEMYDLRQALPEILDVKEAAEMMGLERNWNPERIQEFQHMLTPIDQPLMRWQKSAELAQKQICSPKSN